MTNAFQLFRSLVIYGLCLPLAIFIGYLLATPADASTFISLALFLSLITFPLLMRWHYPMLIFCWNAAAGFYFLPGKPSWALLLIFASFGISFFSFILNRNLKFISVPIMVRPLAFLLVVVLVTARFTGGIGFGAFGASESGGKRYLMLFSGIIGFFALVARKIPREKVDLYIKLYFFGALTALIGSLFAVVTPSLYFIFLIFPAEVLDTANHDFSGAAPIARLAGLTTASMWLMAYMLVRHGLKGVLNPRRMWRILFFIALGVASMFGGYRSKLIELLLTLFILFYLEGLFRSRLLPMLILCAILGVTLIVPFSDRLPMSVQRSLTFLPLKLDPVAELNAKSSSEWRLEMWSHILPQVPKYLILGKGYGIDSRDMDLWESASNGQDSATGAAMAGDYHNGPLSLIMPFGIPGVIAFLWVLIASVRVLHRNYLYGDPELQTLNRYIFAYFLVRIILFFFIFGSLYTDLPMFMGWVGFSIAVNGGVKSAAPAVISRPIINRFKLAQAAR